MRGVSSAAGSRFPPLEIAPTARVFVLTGAGISAESGIRTFRDSGGLWEEYRIEDVASPEGWRRDPELVWRFYSARRVQAAAVAPNVAHVALAKLEEVLGDRLFLCTQNVDALHERGGSTRVSHMHGELMKSRCERCDRPPFDDAGEYLSASAIPRCVCGGRVRPHICWFGELPFFLDDIKDALARSDVFVTIGSSGSVYPASGFVNAARARRGTRCVYVGLEEPENADAFDECRLGKATEIVPDLFRVAR